MHRSSVEEAEEKEQENRELLSLLIGDAAGGATKETLDAIDNFIFVAYHSSPSLKHIKVDHDILRDVAFQILKEANVAGSSTSHKDPCYSFAHAWMD